MADQTIFQKAVGAGLLIAAVFLFPVPGVDLADIPLSLAAVYLLTRKKKVIG